MIAAIVQNFRREFLRNQEAADRTLVHLSDEQFFAQSADHVNSAAIIVKHLAGNLTSRWTDFLTSDGEKPTRDRDGEFIIQPADTRNALMAAWQRAWQTVFDTFDGLSDDDLQLIVPIRGEPHTVFQAMLRSSNHTAYHVGQIVYLVRFHCPDSPWLTIPPGGSRPQRGEYLKPS